MYPEGVYIQEIARLDGHSPYLAKPLGFVHSGSMDKQGMKEHRVPRFHREMNPGSIGIKVPDSVVQLVHTSLKEHQLDFSVRDDSIHRSCTLLN